jgi:hypothetical protein
MLSSPTFTAEVTDAVRGFGVGVLTTQRRAFGMAMTRQMAATTALAGWSRAELKRGMRTTTAGTMSQLASVLRGTAALLDSQQDMDGQDGATRVPANFVITDREKTRC